MKPSATSTDTAKVYLEAARLVAEFESNRSCYAVAVADQGDEFASCQNRLVQRYIEAMLGTYITADLPWPCDFDHNDNRKVRVLLLCFMAAMVEAGDA